jgi:hypothetical protein
MKGKNDKCSTCQRELETTPIIMRQFHPAAGDCWSISTDGGFGFSGSFATRSDALSYLRGTLDYLPNDPYSGEVLELRTLSKAVKP